MRYLLVSCFILSLLFSCKNKNAAVENIPPTTDGINFTSQYSTYKNKIYKYGIPIQVIGANAFHTFGGGSTDMNSWRVDIVREFVGNVKEQPITGFAIQDANGAYLHSLQEVVDSNRQNNKITILCPFRWNGIGNTNFTGKRPTLTYWYTDLKIKLLQWATHFKTQPDVWIELWNEPYRYDKLMVIQTIFGWQI